MLWLVLSGLAVGLFAAWLLLVRLPRDETDIDAMERRDEATWIGHTIEYHGGVAPPSLVEEVLDLHEAYLRDPKLRLVTEPQRQQPPEPPPRGTPGP